MPRFTYGCHHCDREHTMIVKFRDPDPEVCGMDTIDSGCGGKLYRMIRAPRAHSSWNTTGRHGVNGYYSKALGRHVESRQKEQKIMESRGFVCEADLSKDRWDTAVETQKRRVANQDKNIETYTEALKSGKTKEEAVCAAFTASDAVSGKLDETWGKK